MSGQYDRNAFFIGGAWRAAASSATIEVVSPATEQCVARVPRATAADIDAAVAAARASFDRGPWPRLPVSERVAAVRRLREVFARRQEEMAQVITAEMGSPITQSRTIQTTVPLVMMDENCEIGLDEVKWSELRQSSSGSSLVRRQPKGVAALITPWNAPMMTVIQKLAPALISGCTVVLKPASLAPLSGLLLAEFIEQADFPAGVVNVVTCDRTEAEYLAVHPGVNKVTFTGSTQAGRHLAAKCGALLRPITLELGGKSAAIILDDADIGAAVSAMRLLAFRNSGQICTLKTRVLVSKRHHAEVVEGLAQMMRSMPVGDPLDEKTEIGPMVSRRQQENVERHIEVGMAEGATRVLGGLGRPAGLRRGWYVQPTLFTDVHPDSRLAQEEIFGPVLSVIAYESEDDAVAIANNSSYGLSGSVFSQDIEHAIAVADRIQTGTLEVNGAPRGYRSPFGGVKESGLGRESGREGFEPYVEIKSISLPRAVAERFA
ncbi:MAG: aldehyde dehydrogenase [Burkholderiaceae bacterium]